jgi:hypothetical protein
MKRLMALWHRLTSWWQTDKLPDYHQYSLGEHTTHPEDDGRPGKPMGGPPIPMS